MSNELLKFIEEAIKAHQETRSFDEWVAEEAYNSGYLDALMAVKEHIEAGGQNDQ